MTTAAYYREWRAAHPEYREREKARLRRRPSRPYALRPKSQRPSRAIPDVGPLHTGHEAFDLARSIVKRTDGFTILLDPLYDDLIGVAVLAWLEGRDVTSAVLDFARTEKAWRRACGPLLTDARGELLIETDARAGRKAMKVAA